jgi:hypothetical protein
MCVRARVRACVCFSGAAEPLHTFTPKHAHTPPRARQAPASTSSGDDGGGEKPSLLTLLVNNVLRNPYIWAMASGPEHTSP